jgi:hypothetical protein
MVTINIPKEEFEALREVAESRQLIDKHIEVLRKVLMKSGILLKLDEYIATRNGDTICIYSGDLFVEIDLSADTNGKVNTTVIVENVKNVKYRERIDITFVAREENEDNHSKIT